MAKAVERAVRLPRRRAARRPGRQRARSEPEWLDLLVKLLITGGAVKERLNVSRGDGLRPRAARRVGRRGRGLPPTAGGVESPPDSASRRPTGDDCRRRRHRSRLAPRAVWSPRCARLRSAGSRVRGAAGSRSSSGSSATAPSDISSSTGSRRARKPASSWAQPHALSRGHRTHGLGVTAQGEPVAAGGQRWWAGPRCARRRAVARRGR
jgi:hypothetical protein